jgi:hypothetical protein
LCITVRSSGDPCFRDREASQTRVRRSGITTLSVSGEPAPPRPAPHSPGPQASSSTSGTPGRWTSQYTSDRTVIPMPRVVRGELRSFSAPCPAPRQPTDRAHPRTRSWSRTCASALGLDDVCSSSLTRCQLAMDLKSIITTQMGARAIAGSFPSGPPPPTPTGARLQSIRMSPVTGRRFRCWGVGWTPEHYPLCATSLTRTALPYEWFEAITRPIGWSGFSPRKGSENAGEDVQSHSSETLRRPRRRREVVYIRDERPVGADRALVALVQGQGPEARPPSTLRRHRRQAPPASQPRRLWPPLPRRALHRRVRPDVPDARLVHHAIRNSSVPGRDPGRELARLAGRQAEKSTPRLVFSCAASEQPHIRAGRRPRDAEGRGSA